MTITDTKPKSQGLILAVRTIIASTANWRQAMADKYATDIRNEHAAQLLESLAGETPTLPEHLVAEMATCHRLGELVKDTARRVGFSLFPASLIDFLHLVRLIAAEEGR
jgi:hypothetical protein